MDLSGSGHGDDGSGGLAGGGGEAEVLEEGGVSLGKRLVEFGAGWSEAGVGLRQGFRAGELGGERCGGHRHLEF